MVEHPLIKVYGEDAITLATNEIKRLSSVSNIPFDKKYVELGSTFLMIKAKQIVDGEKPKCSLVSLISESFGEAAIYKYNLSGGVL